MAILIANRALVAIRSLPTSDRQQVYALTTVLEEQGIGSLVEGGLLHRMGTSDQQSLYSMSVSSGLRAVISVRSDDHIILEDIVPHGRVENLSRNSA
jgi:hypothetical protein